MKRFLKQLLEKIIRVFKGCKPVNLEVKANTEKVEIKVKSDSVDAKLVTTEAEPEVALVDEHHSVVKVDEPPKKRRGRKPKAKPVE